MNYQARLNKLQTLLETYSSDALLIEDTTNLFYLTGINLSAGKLLIYRTEAYLFVDSRYIELCQAKSPFPVQLQNNGSTAAWFSRPEFKEIKTLAIDSSATTLQQYMEWKQWHIDQNRRLEFVPLDNPCKAIRRIKDPEEIVLLREAAKLGSEGFDFLCTLIKEGISEIDLAIELEIFWKRNGSKGLAFDPIIAFGPNSSMPHYRSGLTMLKQNSSVLIDIGVNLSHYHSDMTRVLFYGTPHPKMEEIFQIVADAQAIALKLCKPGKVVGDLDKAARDHIASKGYGDYFSHSLGHGIGLQVHETPALRQNSPESHLPLKEGMVITIEPGIYLPGIGGVRIEDTIAITADGYENLTSRPKEIYLNL